MTTIREAIAAYCDIESLTQHVTSDHAGNLWQALRQPRESLPPDLVGFLECVQALFTPPVITTITSPQILTAMLMPEAATLDHERLWVICLNARNQVLQIDRLYDGTVRDCHVRVAEVFRSAIRYSATSIMLAHNHHGGSSTPSPEDLIITRLIRQAGQQLEIELLDHLILGHGTWCSIRERHRELFGGGW